MTHKQILTALILILSGICQAGEGLHQLNDGERLTAFVQRVAKYEGLNKKETTALLRNLERAVPSTFLIDCRPNDGSFYNTEIGATFVGPEGQFATPAGKYENRQCDVVSNTVENGIVHVKRESRFIEFNPPGGAFTAGKVQGMQTPKYYELKSSPANVGNRVMYIGYHELARRSKDRKDSLVLQAEKGYQTQVKTSLAKLRGVAPDSPTRVQFEKLFELAAINRQASESNTFPNGFYDGSMEDDRNFAFTHVEKASLVVTLGKVQWNDQEYVYSDGDYSPAMKGGPSIDLNSGTLLGINYEGFTGMNPVLGILYPIYIKYPGVAITQRVGP